MSRLASLYRSMKTVAYSSSKGAAAANTSAVPLPGTPEWKGLKARQALRFPSVSKLVNTSLSVQLGLSENEYSMQATQGNEAMGLYPYIR